MKAIALLFLFGMSVGSAVAQSYKNTIIAHLVKFHSYGRKEI